MFDRLRSRGFDIHVANHADAILAHDFPDVFSELVLALSEVSLPAAEIIASGGGEAASTQRMRRRLAASGWLKHNFFLEVTIDGVAKESISHEIDHVRRTERGILALEIEWNNKDPFFDRDLENFQRLHGQNVISVGIIVTRGAALHNSLEDIVARFIRRGGLTDEAGFLPYGMKERTARQREAVRKRVARGADFAEAFAKAFVADKFGQSTTHWRKLEDRVARGVGSPCPLLLLGLPRSVVSD